MESTAHVAPRRTPELDAAAAAPGAGIGRGGGPAGSVAACLLVLAGGTSPLPAAVRAAVPSVLGCGAAAAAAAGCGGSTGGAGTGSCNPSCIDGRAAITGGSSSSASGSSSLIVTQWLSSPRPSAPSNLDHGVPLTSPRLFKFHCLLPTILFTLLVKYAPAGVSTMCSFVISDLPTQMPYCHLAEVFGKFTMFTL